MRVSVRLEMVLILTQDSRNHFGGTRWNSYVTLVMWNLLFVHLEIVLVLVQDRFMVCSKRTKGSEIVLDARNGTPR